MVIVLMLMRICFVFASLFGFNATRFAVERLLVFCFMVRNCSLGVHAGFLFECIPLFLLSAEYLLLPKLA